MGVREPNASRRRPSRNSRLRARTYYSSSVSRTSCEWFMPQSPLAGAAKHRVLQHAACLVRPQLAALRVVFALRIGLPYLDLGAGDGLAALHGEVARARKVSLNACLLYTSDAADD